jgi:hypothetical protein
MFVPQVLDLFFTPDTVVVGRLLLSWPTLEDLQRARTSEVADFLREHRIPESTSRPHARTSHRRARNGSIAEALAGSAGSGWARSVEPNATWSCDRLKAYAPP